MPARPLPSPVHVVRATPDDWEDWSRLRLRSLRTDPDAFGSAWERERDSTEEQWRERLSTSYAVLARLAAGSRGRADGPVVGMGGLLTTDTGARMVVAMWTVPDRRGQGVGRAVLEHLVAAAGDDRLVLWVADDNPAERLYRALGFVPTGARSPIRPGATLMKSEMERPRAAPAAG